MFLTLYNKIDGKLHFWQTWDNEEELELIINYGIVGTKGKREIFDLSPQIYEDIRNKIEQLEQEGYTPIDIDDHTTLIIEYKIINNWGTA